MGRTRNEKQPSGEDGSTCLNEKEHLLVSRYLDGDLNPEQTRRLEKRLEEDAALRVEVEAMRNLQGAVWQLQGARDTNGARDRVFMRLERATRETAAGRNYWLWLSSGRGGAFAAGLAAATIAGMVFLMPGQEVVSETAETPAAVQPAIRGAQVPLPEVGEIETLSRLHDAQKAEAPEGDVTEGAL